MQVFQSNNAEGVKVTKKGKPNLSKLLQQSTATFSNVCFLLTPELQESTKSKPLSPTGSFRLNQLHPYCCLFHQSRKYSLSNFENWGKIKHASSILLWNSICCFQKCSQRRNSLLTEAFIILSFSIHHHRNLFLKFNECTFGGWEGHDYGGTPSLWPVHIEVFVHYYTHTVHESGFAFSVANCMGEGCINGDLCKPSRWVDIRWGPLQPSSSSSFSVHWTSGLRGTKFYGQRQGETEQDEAD